MSIGLKVWSIWYEVGAADFFYSFFSTINYRLEVGMWGSKYPLIMQHLYYGKLEYENIPAATAELSEIKDTLSKIDTSKVVWDIDDLSKQPPWGNKISKEITSLANYYVTSDGRDLFEVIFKAFGHALDFKSDVTIDKVWR